MRIIIEPVLNESFRNPDGHPVMDRHHHLICRLRDDDKTSGITIVTVDAGQEQQLIFCRTEGGLMPIRIPFVELAGRQDAAAGLDAVGKHKPLPKCFHTGIDGKPTGQIPRSWVRWLAVWGAQSGQAQYRLDEHLEHHVQFVHSVQDVQFVHNVHDVHYNSHASIVRPSHQCRICCTSRSLPSLTV